MKRPRIERDASGVPEVNGASQAELWWGLGYCHAQDRGLQMLLMRILGQGRASEVLDGSDATLAVDLFFRRVNWGGDAAQQAGRIEPGAAALVEAYCEGANARFAESLPWELRLLGYRHSPWTAADSVLLSRIAGYVTLAQSQAELERLLVEMVQAGVDRGRLEELFPGQLEGLDEELLKKVRLGAPLVPAGVRWSSAAPRLMASNNWVVAGTRTASGKPILANDPHLETNRLPNVWYEIVLRTEQRYLLGATMPGLPAVLIGRNPDLAWGATYSFMDSVDSWVEHCRDQRYRRGEEWIPFRVRRETVRRKGQAAHEAVFLENDHGVLDGDAAGEGYSLATRWSAAGSGAASMQGIVGLWDATDVPTGMDLLGRVETAFNWVLADRHGHVGYQMSGRMPLRRPGWSGLVPVPGWDPANDWQGFADHRDLPRALDPEAGFFATANHDLNRHGRLHPINVPMSDYRARRIEAVLSDSRRVTPDACCQLQFDVVSTQAQDFLALLRPLLPDTSQGRLLRDWDCRYDPGSQGAFLFEAFYRALVLEVFGLGEAGAWLWSETGTFADFHGSFDRVLLAERSTWLGTRSRDEVFRSVAARALDVTPQPWGETNRMPLRHILFGGRLPRWLGFDRGPVPLRGGRATVHQGQIYRSGGRLTSFTPSFRMVVDLAEEGARTALAGGPSDRRFSRWYASGIAEWLAGRYKQVRPRRPE